MRRVLTYLGRVSTQGFLPSRPYIPSTRDTPSSSSLPIPPDEVLFRSINAPTRYEEDDIYRLERYLKPDLTLPESDLLKALHAYVADFYGRNLGPEAEISYRSMDGSALLALGILMEELCRKALGETGDLAFIEGEELDDDRQTNVPPNAGDGAAQEHRRTSPNNTERAQASQNRIDDLAQEPDRRKRRKVRHKLTVEDG